MHRITPAQSGFRAYSGGGGRLILDEVDDKKNMQEMKGTAMKGEAFEGVEAPQNYGFTSHNMPAEKDKDGNITDGAEGFMSFMGGNRSFAVASVIDDRRHRLKGTAKGDVAMYRTRPDATQVHLAENGLLMSAHNKRKIRSALVEPPGEQQAKPQPPDKELASWLSEYNPEYSNSQDSLAKG